MAYQGNSHSKRIEEAKVSTVGGATIKETRDMRFRKDAGLIYKNIIKPNLLSFVGASLHSAIDFLLFKNKQNSPPPGYYGGFSSNSMYTNYSGMFRNAGTTTNQIQPIQPTQTTDYKSIVWGTQDKAEKALNSMRAVLAEYGKVSINNLFDIAELTGPGIEGWNYGWLNLSDAYTTMVNGGWYIIVLPDPIRFPNAK